MGKLKGEIIARFTQRAHKGIGEPSYAVCKLARPIKRGLSFFFFFKSSKIYDHFELSPEFWPVFLEDVALLFA